MQTQTTVSGFLVPQPNLRAMAQRMVTLGADPIVVVDGFLALGVISWERHARWKLSLIREMLPMWEQAHPGDDRMRRKLSLADAEKDMQRLHALMLEGDVIWRLPPHEWTLGPADFYELGKRHMMLLLKEICPQD